LQIPNTLPSSSACGVGWRQIESEKLNEALPVFVGRAILFSSPFFDGGVGDAKPQYLCDFRRFHQPPFCGWPKPKVK
jgi:hypothetical protein